MLALGRARSVTTAALAASRPQGSWRFAAAGQRRPTSTAGQTLDPSSTTPNPYLAAALRPQAVNQWMLPYLAAMTPQYVEMLLRGMLYGNHVQGMELFTIMMDTSPELQACWEEYMDALSRKRFTLEPFTLNEDDEPSDTAVEKRDVVNAALKYMRPDSRRDEAGLHRMVREIAWSRFHGTSVMELDWTDKDGERYIRTIPDLGDVQCLRAAYWVHPVCYAFDSTGTMGLSVTRDTLRDASQGAKKKPPTFTNTGNNPRDNVVVDFPENNFVVAVGDGKTGSVYGKSILRPLAWWWLAANFCGDYLMKYAELFGIPLRKATYDPNTPDKVKQEIRQFLQSAGAEPWTMVPKGAEVEFERSAGGGADSPQAFLFRFSNEMIRKVVLHQTMSGGAGSQGTGIGKGGMETEDEGPKADCVSAGADFVARVISEQVIPYILKLNYGEDGDSEAPVAKLVDHEVGGYQDAQRDQVLSQIIDMPDSYVRRKYGIPKVGTGDKLVGQETGTAGAQFQQQLQQYSDQQSNQEAQQDIAMEQAKAMQRQPDDGAAQDDGSGVQARRSLKAKSQTSTALELAVKPIVDRLKAVAAVKDPVARLAAYKKFLADEPALRKQAKQSGQLAKATAAAAMGGFAKGVNS